MTISQPAWLLIILALIAAVGAGIGVIVVQWMKRRHTENEVEDMVTKRLATDLKRVYDENDTLRADMRELRTETARELAEMRTENSVVRIAKSAADELAAVNAEEVRRLQRLMGEVIAHVQRLEGMVPPPPPQRPWEVGKPDG